MAFTHITTSVIATFAFDNRFGLAVVKPSWLSRFDSVAWEMNYSCPIGEIPGVSKVSNCKRRPLVCLSPFIDQIKGCTFEGNSPRRHSTFMKTRSVAYRDGTKGPGPNGRQCGGPVSKPWMVQAGCGNDRIFTQSTMYSSVHRRRP